MIGLDTNVLVRYLTQDDKDQARRATALVRGLTETDRGFVSLVSLVEVTWVLRRAYKLDPQSVAAVVAGLLDSSELHIECPEVARAALAATDRGADFADAVISESARRAGCSHTVTFDRKSARTIDGMELVAR